MKKILITCLLITFCAHSIHVITSSVPGRIIVIHGTPSCGKTSVVNELASQIELSKTEIIDVDQFRRAFVDQKALEAGYDSGKNKHSYWIDYSKITEHWTDAERQESLVLARTLYFAKIKETALSGKIVFVDTLDWPDIEFFLKYMSDSDMQVTLVLLYTPLDTIHVFVEHRNNFATSEDDKRSLLLCLSTYQNLFKPVENENDPVVDCLNRGTAEYYLNCMNQEACWYMQKPENFEQEFIRHFKPDQMAVVKITPVLSYDIIVHGSELLVAQRASVLKKLLNI